MRQRAKNPATNAMRQLARSRWNKMGKAS